MRVRLWLTVLLGVLAVGCTQDNTGTSSTTLTTAPTATLTTEKFAGTVAVGAVATHTFTVQSSGGQLNVILTAAGPPPTVKMALGVGAYTAPTCTLFDGGVIRTAAGAIAQLVGFPNAGSYCVQIGDVGDQTGPVTYAITVTHY